MIRLALVGDFSPDSVAHRAIPVALTRARAELGTVFAWDWIDTPALRDAPTLLAPFAGIWVVPGSPYADMDGALAAIRFARETRRPFLGTCGGFQHALIEYARHVIGLTAADHTESNPATREPVITRLACSLVEQTGGIRFTPGSLLAAIYGTDAAREPYRCNYGPTLAYRDAFARAGLRFTAFDEQGEPRAGELPPAVHPFFLGTLFQPERAALRGESPPVVRAFVDAALRFSP